VKKTQKNAARRLGDCEAYPNFNFPDAAARAMTPTTMKLSGRSPLVALAPARPRNADQPGQTFQSEPARTIKVRGHETLVVRKPKLVGKTPANSNHNPSHR